MVSSLSVQQRACRQSLPTLVRETALNTIDVTVTTQRAPASERQIAALDALLLARSQHAGIAAAENDVVTAYLNLAKALAGRYRGRGVDREDLQQLATLGLIKAVKRWDPQVGTQFVSFAYPTILGEMKRFFRDQFAVIRVTCSPCS